MDKLEGRGVAFCVCRAGVQLCRKYTWVVRPRQKTGFKVWLFNLQTREGADAAKDTLNGVMLHDNELRIGWGKGVALPSVPLTMGSGGAPIVPKGAAIPPPRAEAFAAALPWAAPPVHSEPVSHLGALLGEYTPDLLKREIVLLKMGFLHCSAVCVALSLLLIRAVANVGINRWSAEGSRGKGPF